MEIDWGRNYHNCSSFGHIAYYCHNQRIVEQGRRIEYRNNHNLYIIPTVCHMIVISDNKISGRTNILVRKVREGVIRFLVGTWSGLS